MAQSETGSRLVAVTGLMSGEVFPLASPEVTFGRDAANTICFPDPALSRRHCAFTACEDGWLLTDLGSSNGTFVNGVQVSTHTLCEGDRIAVGGSVLLFVRTTGAATSHIDVTDLDVGAATMRLAIEDARYLRQIHAPEGLTRVEQGLRALLTISTVIHAVRNEPDLRRELLRVLREIVPADAAAVVLAKPDGELEVVDGSDDATVPVQVSRQLVSRVLTERAAVLSRDVVPPTCRADQAAAERSLLCVPLVLRDRAIGALYLVSGQRGAFDEEHMQLATAVARLAAIAIENVRHLAGVEREAEQLHADLHLRHTLVGNSSSMHRVYERLGRVARSDATVLLTGESGTGKELAARAIHLNSRRARRPFIAINCAALTETLLESELFGHERGAFTGAVVQKKGRIELADGGTLFLDEIGELALPLQSKLLRVLQEREVERLGGTRPVKVDVRLISATNRNVAEAVRAGRFREDLFFRLNVVAIHMPPLRDRSADIAALAQFFVNRYAPKSGRPITAISDGALACLLAYEWPGNVRELENAIERAVVLGSTEEILPEDLPEPIIESARAPLAVTGHDSFHAAVREAKKKAIVDAFRAAGGSYTETARTLGIHPNYLHRLVRNLGLKATLTGGG